MSRATDDTNVPVPADVSPLPHHPRSVLEDLTSLWPVRRPGGVLRAANSEPNPTQTWQGLVEALAEQSRYCEDPELAQGLLHEAGRILAERLGRQDEADLLLRQAQGPLTEFLATQASTAGTTTNVATELARLEAQGQDTADSIEARTCAWIEYGLLSLEHSPDPSRAQEAFSRALELTPEEPVALQLRGEIAIATGQTEAAQDALRAQLQRVKAPRHRVTLLVDLADQLEDPEARQALLLEAYGLDPAEQTCLRAAIAGCDPAEPAQLAGLYRDLARVAEDPVSANTALHMAFLAQTRSLEPLDDLLEQLACREAQRPDGADVLAPLAEASLYLEQQACMPEAPPASDHELAILARLAPAIDDPCESALVRERLARLRLAILEGQRDAPDDGLAEQDLLAITAADLRHCLVHLPEHRWAHQALARVLDIAADQAGLVLHLQQWARTVTAGPGRATILLELGRRYETEPDGLARAAEAYELAAAEDPHNPDCLRALGSVYERLGRWPQAVACLRRQIDAATDPQEKLAELRRVAVMAEYELGDTDLAMGALQEIISTSPDDLLALYQLVRLSRSTRRPVVLAAALTALVERIDDDVSRTALWVELGEVQELALKQRDAARHCYAQALELSPGYTPALRNLGRIYRDRGELIELANLLRPEADPVTDPAVLALKAARVLFEEVGDAQGAIEQLWTAYRSNADLLPARELLLHLLTATGQIDEAYDLLRAQDPPKTPVCAADHHYRLGLLAEARSRQVGPKDPEGIKRADAALQHYRGALALQSEHGFAFERARRLLVAHHDHDNLTRLLETQLSRGTATVRAALWVALGRLHLTQLDHREQARHAFETAFETSPDDGLIRHELENLLRLLHDARALPGLYLRRVRDSRDKQLQATLLVEAAELLLQAGAHEDHDLAGKAVLDALRLDPGNPFAVRHLEQLLNEPDSPFIIKEAVSARAVRAQSDAERGLFYLESAELLERAGAYRQASRAYEAALQALPELLPAQLGIERLSGADNTSSSASQLRASVHVLVAEAREATIRAGRGDAQARTQALAVLGDILERDPRQRDAIALARTLAGQVGDAAPVVQLLEQTFARIDDPNLRYELALFLGEHSLSLDQAGRYYEAAATAKPQGRRALRGLIDISRQMGDDQRAATATERLLALFDPGDPGALELRLGIATFLSSSPETAERAMEHVRTVLDARPDEPRALALLAQLLERADQPLEAAAILERLIARERSRERLHELLLRRAKLLAPAAQQRPAALAAIERAATLAPGHRETVTLLIDLLERAGQADRVDAHLAPLRAAVITHVTRGAVSLRDLALLARVAKRRMPKLARIATLLMAALDQSEDLPSTLPAPSPEHLVALLQDPTLRMGLLADAEPPALHRMLVSLDGAVGRLPQYFPVVGLADGRPAPNRADGDPAQVLGAMAQVLDLRPPRLQLAQTPTAAVYLQEPLPTLRIGEQLWNQADAPALKGLFALALARHAHEAPLARALAPGELDLLLAATFELSAVFNPMTADPDPQILAELVSQLSTLLSRRRLHAIAQGAEALSSHVFDPGGTSRALTSGDLRLATLICGDPAATLSAACVLDSITGGSLKQRVNRSPMAQSLIAHLLSDDFLAVAEAAGVLADA